MSARASTAAGRSRATGRKPTGTRRSHPTAKASTAKRGKTAPKRKPGSSPRKPATRPKRGTRGASRPRASSTARGGAWKGLVAWVRRLSWQSQLALAMLAAGGLAFAYYGWLRDSSLVAVTHVEVEGGTSADDAELTAALTRAAGGMTTLHVRTDELAEVAARFPTVASVSADASFPHGLTITVLERRPVLIAHSPERSVPVAANGTLLEGLPAEDQRLPVVEVPALPDSGSLTGEALDEALVIGAAPEPLLAQIERASTNRDLGVVVTLRGGIGIRFGDSRQARAKWRAAAAVLAEPDLTTLSYVDVRVPERPAVGGAGAPEAVATTVAPPPAATDPAATAVAAADATETTATTPSGP